LERWLNPSKVLRPQTTVESLAQVYEKKLTDLKLCQLPQRPRFIFCATDMAFGVNWVFERDQAGDYQIGYVLPPPADWTVARAVAASSCFPPVFGPMIMDLRKYSVKVGNYPNNARRQNLLGGLQLTDGGVYDNMGLEPVWKDNQVVMVSDGGAPLSFQNETDPFRRILRYTAIVSNQAGAVRKRWLIAGFKTQVFEGTYWGVGAVLQVTAPPIRTVQLSFRPNTTRRSLPKNASQPSGQTWTDFPRQKSAFWKITVIFWRRLHCRIISLITSPQIRFPSRFLTPNGWQWSK
jgi:predicted acylesterase/phospholipase RssA